MIRTTFTDVMDMKYRVYASEHGKVEILATVYSDGVVEEIKRAQVEFCGMHYSVNECFNNTYCGTIRDFMTDFLNGRYLIEYGWECISEMKELAEIWELFVIVLESLNE